MNKKTIFRIISVAFSILIWQTVSMIVNADFLFASPIAVSKRLVTLLFEPDFSITVLFSFLRISLGFLLAFVFGILFSLISGYSSFFEYLLWPFVISVKSVPIASFIILCLIWLDFNILTVVISMLIAFPVIYSNVLQGIKSTDKGLIELSDLYNVPFNRRLLYIYIPTIKPFLLSSCNVAIGMAWKAGVAAEVIGVIKGSIGGKLYDAKIYFQNADLLAWTVVIILISVLSEKIFLKILKFFFTRLELK